MKQKKYKKIAVEESWMPTELFEEFMKLSQEKCVDPGFLSLWGEIMMSSNAEKLKNLICDINNNRIKKMDDVGIDIQILSLTAPGVQIFEKDKAVKMARFCNDKLAEEIKINPERFIGLATVAPQDPIEAAKELERCIGQLGMKGVIINSHTNGEFLDNKKFWPILKVAEKLDVPIYLHPNTPCSAMIDPYTELPLEGAIWGFAADCGLHALRMILGGVFDQFPKLKVVLGHLGEGIPWFINRIDNQYDTFVQNASESPRAKKLKRTPKEYFLENFYITSSGMNWELEIMYSLAIVGEDNILFAVDYPFSMPEPAIENVDKLPISDDFLIKFYQKNAENVFSLLK
ncbi:amidohydrolase family protein [Photobacterium damselae subsp. piscicida]|uniref:Amidohydrolase n=1 Tax=Photobacterium damsela subsp. piscicida TaxID=38294 RepID=A0A1V1VGY9_PHODP|nr:amidohydrolase family protein [Photobacterium damselae]MDP2516812.1 amidohydrolase family protein [Photobacterium damselae subsp. piscicida]MDP2543313.1 amidohydrolase family protein [Photobacterium damselae subsp. piscicida]MDP2558448.1 amidohydrolase family protein [Photobacterium damselae subsp. piscicida]QOD55118.1 amidohydrolase [Photobacterium damselae subsp. piscicida]QOD58943.1 amidohydrolase [Photobacterium damselae subsp. piscicida]